MKPIRISAHARRRSLLRGATEAEVLDTIRTGRWQPAQRGKLQVRKAFAFGQPSPVNQQVYASKIIHVIFVNEPQEIIVITVLVYYAN